MIEFLLSSQHYYILSVYEIYIYIFFIFNSFNILHNCCIMQIVDWVWEEGMLTIYISKKKSDVKPEQVNAN